jgi:TonB family protein
MLDPSRTCRRLGFAGLVALALACGDRPPPATPASAEPPPEATGDTGDLLQTSPVASSEPPAAEPPSATTAGAAPAGAEAAPEARTKDTRGKEEIQQVMAANRDKVRACYDAALPQNPGIQGDLVVDFVIDPHGEVKQAEVNWSQSELHVPEIDTCAVEAVKSIKFPASSRGLESKVSYPFNFKPPRTDPPRKEPAGPSRR